MRPAEKLIRAAAFTLLVTIIFAIFVGGTQPVAVNLFTPPWDKLVHCLIYGLMLGLASLTFPKTNLILLTISIIAIGSLDEIHQIYIPGRSAGLDDLTADAIGALIAYFAIRWIVSLNKKAHYMNELFISRFSQQLYC